MEVKMVVYGVFYNNNYDCTELVEIFIDEMDAENYMKSTYNNDKYAHIMKIDVY